MALRSSPAEFLKVPPFPGARVTSLIQTQADGETSAPSSLDNLIARIRELRVGGAYWAAQPVLPDRYRLVRIRDPGERARHVAGLGAGPPIIEWIDRDWPRSVSPAAQQVVGPCDPWYMFAGAEELVGNCDDDVAPIAMLTGVPATWLDDPDGKASLSAWLRQAAALAYQNPFTDETMSFAAAAELCGMWRRLIDSNRSIEALFGFAMWKRATVSPLLWGGGEGAPFVIRVDRPAAEVAVWRSKAEAAALEALERSGAKLVEVEDGFVRSAGLGADCVPPLSIVVDRLGIYFDPGQPSDLETLLESGEFPPELLRRARALREQIVDSGVTKYAVGERHFQRFDGERRQLLVVGQVEDDRAVVSGQGPRTNMDLLRRVRADNPDAHILYKPHPDVEAGHRRGAVADNSILAIADQIIRDFPISSLIAAVDEVHVNTSLAGFEALMRGKAVTAYGVPFYAGWGLTHDRGPVPARRTARRSLDELVAAALLLYPRYLDPVTGLPCNPEVLISRLSSNEGEMRSPIVHLRRFQGRMNRVVAAVRSRL